MWCMWYVVYGMWCMVVEARQERERLRRRDELYKVGVGV